MNPALYGSWRVDKARTTGMADFMKAIGGTPEQLAMLGQLEITLTISQEGSGYKFVTDLGGAVPSNTYVATPGSPCDVGHLDGTKSQMVISFEGDTTVETYTDAKRGAWVTRRTVSGNEMVSVARHETGTTMNQILTRV